MSRAVKLSEEHHDGQAVAGCKNWFSRLCIVGVAGVAGAVWCSVEEGDATVEEETQRAPKWLKFSPTDNRRLDGTV